MCFCCRISFIEAVWQWPSFRWCKLWNLAAGEKCFSSTSSKSSSWKKNIYCELEIFVLKHSLHLGKCLIVWSFCFQKQIWATTSTLLALRIKAYKNISLGEVKYWKITWELEYTAVRCASLKDEMVLDISALTSLSICCMTSVLVKNVQGMFLLFLPKNECQPSTLFAPAYLSISGNQDR